MIRIVLKRIDTNKEEYISEKDKIVSSYVLNGNFDIDFNIIDECADVVKHNGEEITIEFDENKLDEFVYDKDGKFQNKYEKEAELSTYLTEIFGKYPQNIIYDANVWTYLNLGVLNKYVKELYLKEKYENPEDRINRYLFNMTSHSKIDRTGMRFLWYFGSKLHFDENKDRAYVAMEYIDPVKAIFERKMACNDVITMAFVDAIIKGGKNNLMKNNVMRKAVPHHIQCYAGVTNLDAFNYDELVDVMLKEQNRILSKA